MSPLSVVEPQLLSEPLWLRKISRRLDIVCLCAHEMNIVRNDIETISQGKNWLMGRGLKISSAYW